MPTTQDPALDRNLALEVVRVTEAAAIAASRHMGQGDERAADMAAIQAMRAALDSLQIQGTVVIGENVADESVPLHPGVRVGSGEGPDVDVALDPLEGATITARGGDNALSVVAMSESGGFLAPPCMYMDKLAAGDGLPADLLDLDADPTANLRELAKAKRVEVADLVVCILDRPRHSELIRRIREAGARIRLIDDGDVSAAIATCDPDSGIDLYMGIGGAPEGVLGAAALRCMGGQMQARLVFRTSEEKAQAREMGIDDLDRKYATEDLARGHVMFAATGVTDGALLPGVRWLRNGAITHSVIMRSKTGTTRYVEARHNFGIKGRPVARGTGA